MMNMEYYVNSGSSATIELNMDDDNPRGIRSSFRLQITK